jgi:hypothetical protein
MKAHTDPQKVAVKQLKMPCTVPVTSIDYIRRRRAEKRRCYGLVRSFATSA